MKIQFYAFPTQSPLRAGAATQCAAGAMERRGDQTARREDPSRVTRAELTARAIESVGAIGGLARSVGKAASSPAAVSRVGYQSTTSRSFVGQSEEAA